jgi:hypothetical protein
MGARLLREQTPRHNFMSFCNFHGNGGNFAGQINSIKVTIGIQYLRMDAADGRVD